MNIKLFPRNQSPLTVLDYIVVMHHEFLPVVNHTSNKNKQFDIGQVRHRSYASATI